MKRVKTAFEELEVRPVSLYVLLDMLTTRQQYMREMIHARRTAEKKEERYDLFSSLLEASEDELDGTVKLSDQELLGQSLFTDRRLPH